MDFAAPLVDTGPHLNAARAFCTTLLIGQFLAKYRSFIDLSFKFR